MARPSIVVTHLFSALLIAGCDPARVYETNYDMKNGQWLLSDSLSFNITVPDTSKTYNVFLNIRNTIDFETARLFVQYQLADSTMVIRKRLVEYNLFDRKTGEPFGDSGLGNIYSHQILLEHGIRFHNNGSYAITLNHMMRSDTLAEIRSVGIRVEQVNPQ